MVGYESNSENEVGLKIVGRSVWIPRATYAAFISYSVLPLQRLLSNNTAVLRSGNTSHQIFS